MPSNHLPNHKNLLSVFPAKHRDIGLNQFTQSGNNGQDSIKVAGAMSPLEKISHCPRRNYKLPITTLGIDRGKVGHKYGINPRSLKKFEIPPFVARVALKIFTGAKLQWVYKNGHHNPIGQLTSASDQSQMAIV